MTGTMRSGCKHDCGEAFCPLCYCHAGKGVLTQKGMTAKTAMILQDWVTGGNKKCLKCHIEKKQFKLNAHGEEILNSQKGLLGM